MPERLPLLWQFCWPPSLSRMPPAISASAAGFSASLATPAVPTAKKIYPAAKGLQDLGILPGQTVACFGDMACYVDIYWARLAGTPIRAEIEVPNGGDAGEFWNAQTNKAEVLMLSASAILRQSLQPSDPLHTSLRAGGNSAPATFTLTRFRHPLPATPRLF